MSAYYPESPSDQEKEKHQQVLTGFGNIAKQSQDFEKWGSVFSKYLDEHPPKLENREDFSVWM